ANSLRKVKLPSSFPLDPWQRAQWTSYMYWPRSPWASPADGPTAAMAHAAKNPFRIGKAFTEHLHACQRRGRPRRRQLTNGLSSFDPALTIVAYASSREDSGGTVFLVRRNRY